MAKTIEAIYKDGVIKPLEKIELRENERVRITITKTKKSKTEKPNPDPKKDPILNLIGDVSHGSLAKDIDKELYGE
jgi:Uncharacterized protein conserved in archaea